MVSKVVILENARQVSKKQTTVRLSDRQSQTEKNKGCPGHAAASEKLRHQCSQGSSLHAHAVTLADR